ncbi:MAG: redoxin family protein [Pirellulaceae bacterium]
MHCQTRDSSKQTSPPSNLRSALGLRKSASDRGWRSRLVRPIVLASALLPLAVAQVAVAADQTEKLTKALSYKPRQADVNYELVPAAAISECEIDETARPDGKGFWVTGASGQPLRWFADTNADNRLDRWCYYNAGVEVYRESDTNFNGTADEYRWLSTEGMRWGIDKNEDGTIDSWKLISAEEVTAEVVRAAATKDINQFQRLLISDEEIGQLGLGKDKAAALRQHVVDAAKQFSDWASGQNVVSSKSKWTNFGADKPGIVPAGTDGSEKDVVVYENVVALLEDAGNTKQLLVGTMIQVGGTWRLVDLPRAVSEGAVVSDASIFFPASFTPRGGLGAGSGEAVGGISKTMQKLVTDLQDVDAKLQAGGNTAMLQAMRADVLEKLVSSADTPEERTTWIKQFADTVSAASQTGDYPDGAERLNDFASKLSTVNPTNDDIAYVIFRSLTAEHNQKMQDPNAEFEQLQKVYLEDLQKFVGTYPNSPDAAEAMIQIALSAEFSGEEKIAKQWYTKASNNFSDTNAGKKASGALERLDLVGQKFGLLSPTLDGRKFSSEAYLGGPVVYHCWASWCEGCKAEMRALNELKSKYAKTKFQVVGINFDNQAETAKNYIRENRYDWIQLHDEGGLESNLAVGYGILTLPFNVVVDKTGKVVKTGVHWTELDSVIEDLVK